MIIEVCRNHYEEGRKRNRWERPHAKRLVHDADIVIALLNGPQVDDGTAREIG